MLIFDVYRYIFTNVISINVYEQILAYFTFNDNIKDLLLNKSLRLS